MAEPAVTFLLQQLGTLINEESKLLGGLRENVVETQLELSRMRAFLRVADELEETDHLLKEWVKQVREVAYDAEDIMDRFMIRFAGRQQMDNRFFDFIIKFYISVKNLKSRHQIANEILAIQSRVKTISEGHLRYRDIYGTPAGQEYSSKPVTNNNNNTWYDSRGDAFLLEDADVVGIEGPKKKLMDWIYSMDSGLKVISVAGTGGSGKSTLVRRVYDNPSVKIRFNAHVWLTVSESFKLEELLRNLIRKLVSEVKKTPPHDLNDMNAYELKEFIKMFLQDRNYIICLDDVWKLEAWEAIRYAFPTRDNTRGCILITTRFHNIGHAAASASSQRNGHVYSIQPLPKEQAKILFYNKAFAGHSCPSYLEEVTENILKRCEGLPLAIVVIGGILANKNNNIQEWRKFHRSLGSELEEDHLRRMTKLLSLSYYDLPYYLKSCFQYLCIFPQDHYIDKNKLIQMWVAEGFIQQKEGKTMEEVGEDYLKELMDRSLIEAAETTNYGKPTSLRVHDLLHAIILSKSTEQGFATIANGGGDTSWPDKSRRLAIHSSIQDTEEFEIRGCDNIRSLLVLEPYRALSEQNLSKLLSRGLRLIKILELSDASLDKIPDGVFKLRNLKYLSLEGTNVNTVPKSIGKLQNLETLNMIGTNVTQVPIDILRLKQLRHLLAFTNVFHRGYRSFENKQSLKVPYKIGCFSSLQTLSDIEAGEIDDDTTTTVVKEIGKLIELRSLSLMKLRETDGKDLCSSLANLSKLHSLYIGSINEDEIMDLQYPIHPTPPPLQVLEIRGRLPNVPKWISSLHGLTRLYLKWTRLEDDPLESIQNLPCLDELELYHTFVGEGLCFKVAKFPKLRKLALLKLQGLKWVMMEQGSIPLLQELYVWGCKLLMEVPSGIEFLNNLKYIDFSDMGEGFEDILENQKKSKLGHVPKIEIYSLIDGIWNERCL